jgi:hypothetical protein
VGGNSEAGVSNAGTPAPQPVADTAPATTKGKGVILAGAPGPSPTLTQAEIDYLIDNPYDPKKDKALRSQPTNAFERIEELERAAFQEVDGSRTISG